LGSGAANRTPRNDKTPHFCGVLKRGGRDSNRGSSEESGDFSRIDGNEGPAEGHRNAKEGIHETHPLTHVSALELAERILRLDPVTLARVLELVQPE
jgi:hypothetical protein